MNAPAKMIAAKQGPAVRFAKAADDALNAGRDPMQADDAVEAA